MKQISTNNKYDIFISFSRNDYEDTNRERIGINHISKIILFLDNAGIKYCFDQYGTLDSYEIVDAIKESHALLFLSSANSNTSEWVLNEVEIALHLQKRIIPLKLDDTPYRDPLSSILDKLDSIEFYLNEKKALFQLLQAIQNLKEERQPSHSPFTIDIGANSTDIRHSAAEQSINYWPASKGLPSGECNKVYGNRIGHHFSPMQRLINWLSKSRKKTKYVYSSVFAPAQISPRSHMLIQVFLHYPEVTEKLKTLAKESQETAERRDYIPLECRLKKGDKVDVQMSIYGTKPLMSESKTITWHGPYKKCSFEFFVDEGIGVNELSCTTLLTVNGMPIGEMMFITKIVEMPQKLNTEVHARNFKKIFISYAHQDEPKVKYLAEGFRAMKADYFFDRHYLKTGDPFPKTIEDYINHADLFILCWSQNAAQSDYVRKEYMQALKLAFPFIRPAHISQLSIYPLNIEPKAELPREIKEYYQYGEL